MNRTQLQSHAFHRRKQLAILVSAIIVIEMLFCMVIIRQANDTRIRIADIKRDFDASHSQLTHFAQSLASAQVATEKALQYTEKLQDRSNKYCRVGIERCELTFLPTVDEPLDPYAILFMFADFRQNVEQEYEFEDGQCFAIESGFSESVQLIAEKRAHTRPDTAYVQYIEIVTQVHNGLGLLLRQAWQEHATHEGVKIYIERKNILTACLRQLKLASPE